MWLALVVVAAFTGSTEAAAQTRRALAVRGFGDASAHSFSAKDSFEAVFGTAIAPFFGGGIEIVERHNIFAALRVSRFHKAGERVFLHNHELFRLGVPTTVTLTPIEVTGGYRIGRWRATPYMAGGIGWHRYVEKSPHSTETENVEEMFIGYHVLGGAEIPLWRWIAVAGEIQWTAVPDAIGQDPNSIAREFGEDDLGGLSVRVKIVIGREDRATKR